jgi:putative Mg2+ transporter-C (MgtC) family protein
MTIWSIIGRLGLAFMLGALVGWEREHEDKPAGLRTLILVSTGSALFMLVTQEAIEMASMTYQTGPVRVDPVRVIASVAQGVGFLGAGTILITRGMVLGLTTAAAIWATSAVGVACGLGLWQIALVGTGLTFVALRVLGPLTRFTGRNHHKHRRPIESDEKP